MSVVISATAEKDLADLYTYIHGSLNNPIAAKNTAARILRTASKLADFPELGATLQQVDSRLSPYRYLLVSNYVLVYKVFGPEVQIVRILYARSDYVSLLGK